MGFESLVRKLVRRSGIGLTRLVDGCSLGFSVGDPLEQPHFPWSPTIPRVWPCGVELRPILMPERTTDAVGKRRYKYTPAPVAGPDARPAYAEPSFYRNDFYT